MQLWTITRAATDEVLYAAFGTPSQGSHPKDNGWEWDAATQKATRIAAAPDQKRERWNGAAWVPDLTALRTARWALVKARRDQAEWWGCSTALGRVDTDPESQRKTSGAVQLAMIAQATGTSFEIDWTMQDNGVAAHDAAAMIAMGVAVGQHVAACHAAALMKRQALANAADVAAIEAVDLDNGWPDAPAG